MGYKFWCQSCGHNYYTVGSGQWNTPGTITVYPSYGYCGPCCGRGGTSWTWKGNVVKLECHGCTNIIGVVSWKDWRGSSGESTGFCNGCHNEYQREQQRKRQEEERREIQRKRKEIQRLKRLIEEKKEEQERRERQEIQRLKRLIEEEKEKKKEQDRILLNKIQQLSKKFKWYCPPSYTFSAPSWASTSHSINRRLYRWQSIKVTCIAKGHEVLNATNSNDINHSLVVQMLCYPCCPWCEMIADQKVQQAQIDADQKVQEALQKMQEEQTKKEQARKDRENKAKRWGNYCPSSYSFSAPSWAKTKHSIDGYNYCWDSIEVSCKASGHVLMKKTSPNHSDVVKLLSRFSCPKCEQEKEQARKKKHAEEDAKRKKDEEERKKKRAEEDAKRKKDEEERKKKHAEEDAKRKKDEEEREKLVREKIEKKKQDAKKAASKVEKQLDDLLGDSSEFKQNDDEVDLKDIHSLVEDINAGIAAAEEQLQAAIDLKDDIDIASKEVDDVLGSMENTQAFTMESEYEEIIEKLQTMRNSLTAKKQKLRQKEKEAMEQENSLLDEQNKLNEAKKKANQTKMELDEKRRKLETCKLDMAKFGITADNVGEEALNELSRKFQEAYSELLTKYADNAKQIKALNECEKRMRDIKGKIMRNRSHCKYLIELLDAECTRLNEASDKAMAKFEQRTNYFLSMTCELPQDVVSKFIDDEGYQLEDILELTKQDLKEMGLKGGVITRIMRNIRNFNSKQSSK